MQAYSIRVDAAQGRLYAHIEAPSQVEALHKLLDFLTRCESDFKTRLTLVALRFLKIRGDDMGREVTLFGDSPPLAGRAVWQMFGLGEQYNAKSQDARDRYDHS